jgi:hypothetical protein
VWRSVRRQRSFLPLVVEVALGFFIIANLWMTIRYYASATLPGSGHREVDVLEVTSRHPTFEADPGAARLRALRARELGALGALPGVRAVAPVSSTEIDDRWMMPTTFWSPPGAAAGPSACAGVEGRPAAWAADTVVVTRCLADALFGGAPAVGRTLLSDRRPPARIVGVVDDVRMHVPFLYQTRVTALYAADAVDDPRHARVLVRVEPGRGDEVRAAATAALEALEPSRDRLIVVRPFSLAGTHCEKIARGTAIVLITIVGVLGVLAVLGNMSVAAFVVGARRRVLGVRRAMGARRWDIFRYLLIENILPTQLGNALGLLLTLATVPAAKARFSGLTFGAADALGTALLLTVGGILAKLLPALRATRIPPSEVTRAL